MRMEYGTKDFYTLNNKNYCFEIDFTNEGL